MQKHELKTWPAFFVGLVTGAKTFEVRKNDRLFNLGDRVIFREWCPMEDGGAYTGRSAETTIRQIWHNLPGMEKGYVVFTFDPVAERQFRCPQETA